MTETPRTDWLRARLHDNRSPTEAALELAEELEHELELERAASKAAQTLIFDAGEQLERQADALADARRKALEEAAKVCEQLQREKDARVPDDAWRTLGTTEISGQAFAAAIRALSAPQSDAVFERAIRDEKLM